VRILFVLTVFLGSALLFIVQPMFARMALPLLGGTPAVWNTCMVFFQGALLAGYLYAHLIATRLPLRAQVAVHAAILLVPLIALPIAIGEHWQPPADSNPVLWLLLLLAAALGLPFFVVSSQAPLIQRWYSRTGAADARDPYFLYAASNAGSMLALISYPLLIEPRLGLEAQSWWWMIGYVALIGMTMTIGVCAWKRCIREPARAAASSPGARADASEHVDDISRIQRARWIALAFVPSALMLAVTAYITTDLASIPLLWVIPLALYLLSFVFVFARRQIIPHAWMIRALPVAAVLLALLMLMEAASPILLIVAIHLAVFFVASMVCHGELARDRPDASRLTEFYLCLSVGGVFGGAFTGLAAPVLFGSIVEYPLALILACALCPGISRRAVPTSGRAGPVLTRAVIRDLISAVLVAVVTAAVLWIMNEVDIEQRMTRAWLAAGIPVVASYVLYILARRPLRLALGLGAVFIISGLPLFTRGDVAARQRSFFGVHRVIRSETAPAHTRSRLHHALYHGTTLHGEQRLDPATLQPAEPRLPLAYFHPDGPAGQVFGTLREENRLREIGIVGLGAGSLFAYAEPGQRVTCFEIDPVVKEIATDERFFTFVSAAQTRGVQTSIVLGDARLTLAQSDRQFDLLVLDAFSSDAIPIHLLTYEAFEVYLGHTAEGGVIAFHISSRHFDLEPVLANVAKAHGLICLVRDDTAIAAEERERTGRRGSTWALMARGAGDLRAFSENRRVPLRWRAGRGDPSSRLWTDDYASVISAFMWP